jgi:hypothetical protein
MICSKFAPILTYPRSGLSCDHQQRGFDPVTGDIAADGVKMVVRTVLSHKKIEIVTADFFTGRCPGGKDSKSTWERGSLGMG